MKIYVVNLKGSVARRNSMEEQLKKLNLSYEIFEAVNGREFTEAEISRYYDMDFYKNRKPYYTAGIIGCTLSHCFLYEKIVDEGIPSALILEDDMIIGEGLKSILPILEKSLKNEEVIMLFYQSKSPIKISNPTPLLEKKEGFSLYDVENISVLGSTAGYLINYETAKGMTEKLLPLTTGPDDWGKFNSKKIINNVKVVYPFVLMNSYASTTINSTFKENTLGKRLLNSFEKYKVFPIYQILKNRRKRYLAKMQKIQVLDHTIS